MATFQSLPGFREFYPDAMARRAYIFRLWRQTAAAFGFSEYDAPVLEPLELYKTKSGDEIESQLFSFTDKGGREVALRPEMTPTVCRMVGAKASSLKRPIKWYSIAEYYRYERAQKGRERAFFQFNADLFAEPGPEAEIELISLLTQCLRSFGLTEADFYVRLSDRNVWFYYLEALGLDEPRIRAVLTAVDKFEKSGPEAFNAYAEKFGPLKDDLRERILAFLKISTLEALELVLKDVPDEKLSERLADWRKLLGGLDAMGLGKYIQVDLGVVRGLAYYTGFVFEAFDRKGELRAIAGGGRYNDLVAKLGGPEMPAVGFAIGDVTLGLLLQARGLMPAFVQSIDVYCVIGGEAERRAAFADIQALRAAGFRVEYPLRDVAFGKQFKLAADVGAKLTLIYGADEIAKGVVKLRDMSNRSEFEVPRADAMASVRDFFLANEIMASLRPRTRRYWIRFAAATVVLYASVCAIAWIASDSMMFFPGFGSRSEPSKATRLTLEDGTQVSAVFLPNPDADFTLWYFHGNAEALADIDSRLQELQSLGFAVFAVEYPGYGTSAGSPTEAQIYSTLPAGLSYLRSELKVSPEQLVVYGRSIGGGPAVELASRQEVAGLIVESTFISAYRVMTRWPLLLGDKFTNLRKIARIDCPVLVIHGRDDHVIPFHHGEALFAAAPSKRKRHLWVDLGGHNDLPRWAGESYSHAIVSFRESLDRVLR